MRVDEVIEMLGIEPLALPAPTRAVTGAYAGDLLSWVMGRAKEGDVWVTVMTNANTIAVATLSDVSLMIVADASEVPEETITLALNKGVNMARTAFTTYEICARLHEIFSL